MADRIIGRLAYKIVGDDKQFKKALQRSTRELDKTADRFQQIGSRLSLFVTAPIAAAGGAAVRAASDLEESLNAVNVVFGDSADQITDWGENAATQAGLAQSEFNTAAVRLGASLKNAGLPLDDVAGSTINLTERAADLASVFNTDVNDALGAIQAAIRGESDPIERFGASINAAAVEAKALELGLAGSKSEITEQIKVQARLALIMEQTADVQGDFANTADSAANSLRITKAEVTDLAAELGAELLPIAQAVISELLELVKEFKDLSDSQKTAIIQVAAFAAAMGPLSVGIGTAIKAVNALKLAAVALGGASGLGLVVLAVGAVATAVRVIRGPIREARASLDELAGASEDTAKELDEVARALSESEQFSENFEDVERNVRQIADASGRTVDEVIEIGLATSRLGDEYQDQLRTLKDQRDVTEEITDENDSATEAASRRSGIEADVADYVREQYELRVRMRSLDNQQIDLRQQLATIDELIAARVLTEEEGLERKIELRQDEIDKLREINGYEQLSEVQRRAALESIGDDVQAQEDMIRVYQARINALNEISDEIDNQVSKTDDLKAKTEQQRDVTADLAKIHGQELSPVLGSMIRDAEDFTDVYSNLASMAGQAWGDVFSGLGEAIINTEDGLESIGRALSNLFVGILKTLGDQFAAMAAAALFGMPPTFIPNPAAAATYGAASAGFYAASGVAGAISAFANGGSFTADQPTLALFGENGPETVDIQPVPKVGPPGATQGSGQTIVVNGDVYGYNDFARKVEQAASRSARLGRTGRQ